MWVLELFQRKTLYKYLVLLMLSINNSQHKIVTRFDEMYFSKSNGYTTDLTTSTRRPNCICNIFEVATKKEE